LYSFEIWEPVVQTDYFLILNEEEKQILNEKEKRDGGERKVRNNDDEDIGEDLCELKLANNGTRRSPEGPFCGIRICPRLPDPRNVHTLSFVHYCGLGKDIRYR